jgi:hypothetical protein
MRQPPAAITAAGWCSASSDSRLGPELASGHGTLAALAETLVIIRGMIGSRPDVMEYAICPGSPVISARQWLFAS